MALKYTSAVYLIITVSLQYKRERWDGKREREKRSKTDARHERIEKKRWKDGDGEKNRGQW